MSLSNLDFFSHCGDQGLARQGYYGLDKLEQWFRAVSPAVLRGTQ